MAVEIDRQPEQYEEYSIDTWVNPHASRLISPRNFELSDSNGVQFGRAISQWCVIDFEKRMPVSLEEIDSLFEGKFCDAPAPCEAPRKVRGIEPSVVRKHEVRYSDIDFNRHVNTMRYIRMMLNTLPIEYLTENRPLRLDIHFAKECRLGEVLTIGYEQRDNLSLFEIRNGDNAVACTAAIEWR
jgi:acyl-ACP thioesterase